MLELQDRGYVSLSGSFSDTPWDNPPGSYDVGLSWFLTPEVSAAPSNVLCLPAGVLEVSDQGNELTSAQAVSLGDCAGGVPVEGSLYLCSGPSCVAPFVSGELEGVPVALDTAGAYANDVPPPSSYVVLQNQELTVRAYTDAAPGSGGMGSVELGLIFTEGGSQYGGAVYCAGPGSSWTSEGGTLTVSIPSLTKLGSCLAAEPGDGELHACL